jgi:isopentenyl-diphosphate delta-isomerase
MATVSTASNDFALRKAQHLDICLDHDQYRVETTSPLFEGIRFYHKALPEINTSDIDLRTDVLGFKARAPIFISCMTGGSEKGYALNKELAYAAEELQIPVGMGSNRILWKKPETLPHFQFRKYAPTVPILSNIGAVQIRDMDHQELIEMNKRLEVSAQVIHLNPGQELFQPEGDRDFAGILPAIKKFIAASPHPVILKETGFGIAPAEVESLLSAGAEAVDLAGAGGTNWIAVEGYRAEEQEQKRAGEFDHWGHPTALLLASLRSTDLPGSKSIWASGGLRSGMDVAKSLALGADMAGLAMGFAEAVVQDGRDGVIQHFDDLEKTLRDVMLLTGSRNLAELKDQPLWFTPGFSQLLANYHQGQP